jgi:hypothetical protein
MSATAFQRRRREIAKLQAEQKEKEGVKDDNNTRKSKKRTADNQQQ